MRKGGVSRKEPYPARREEGEEGEKEGGGWMLRKSVVVMAAADGGFVCNSNSSFCRAWTCNDRKTAGPGLTEGVGRISG